MSNAAMMEKILHELLPDLQKLYKQSRNQAAKKKILRYVERINEALAANDNTPQQ